MINFKFYKEYFMQHLLFLIIHLLLLPTVVLAQVKDQPFQKSFQQYPVKAGECSKITTNSGSIIFIEEGAIPAGLDSTIIYYRELHTPLDIIAHDIRMHTMPGEIIYLESTGMFEIYALAGNDTVAMAPGKSIEVRMAVASQKADPRVEGYIYDQKNKHWQNFTNQINILKIDDDNHLWGSPPARRAAQVDNNLPAEMNDGRGTDEPNTRLTKVLQTMLIDQFGLYNFDKMLGGFNYTYVKAAFNDAHGTSPIESTIYLVYKNINSVFYFPKASWTHDFFIIQNLPYKLFTITARGKVLQLKDYPQLSAIANKPYSFTLETQGQAKNRRELSKIIGIQ
jgi:hypothetical protein